MLPTLILCLILCVYVNGQHNIKISFFVTPSEKEDYLSNGKTAEDMDSFLRKDAPKLMADIFNTTQAFPWNVKFETKVVKVIEDQNTVNTWFKTLPEKSAKWDTIKEICKYGNANGDDADVNVLLFSKEEADLLPYRGISANRGTICAKEENQNCVLSYGQVYYKGGMTRMIYDKLLAHEIGHLWGANDHYPGAPMAMGGKVCEFEDIMRYPTTREKLWGKCSLEWIEDCRIKEKFTCLGIKASR